MKNIYIDTETSSLPHERDGNIIVQLSVIIEENKNVDIYTSLCKPSHPIEIEASMKHGITNIDVGLEPDIYNNIKEVPVVTNTTPFKKLIENIDNSNIIGFNLPFHIDVLKRVYDIDKHNFNRVDMLKITKHLYGSTLYNSEIEKNRPKHFSLNYMTYFTPIYKTLDIVFNNIVDKHNISLKEISGVKDLISLNQLTYYYIKKFNIDINWMAKKSTEPAFIEYFNFGKYKDKKISDVDGGYLEYMSRNIDDEDLKYSIDKIIYDRINNVER